MRFGIRPQAVLLAGVPLAALLALLALATLLIRHTEEAGRANELITQSQDLLETIGRANHAVQKYARSKNSEDLAPFFAARTQLPEEEARLAGAVRADPVLRARRLDQPQAFGQQRRTAGGGRSCTIAIRAPHGTDTFTVTIYAGAGGTGAVLGVGTSTAIVGSAGFTVPVGVDGVPASLEVTAGATTFTTGTAGTTPISVTAIDADGTTKITGTYAHPVTLAITGNSAGFTLSTTTVTASGQSVTLAYDGSPGVRTIGVSATASGVAPTKVTPVAVSVAPILNIYALNGASPATLTVFPANANGDTAPSRTITGSNTLFANVQSVAVDATGKIYVECFRAAGGYRIRTRSEWQRRTDERHYRFEHVARQPERARIGRRRRPLCVRGRKHD